MPESYSSIIDLCEDLLRTLRNFNQSVFDAEVLYVQSFMDRLRDYVEVNGNSLHAFLKDWEGNKDNISSPKVGDAVRIMTIHKSKGLDFRYVIVPYLEGVGLVKYEKKWCKPDVSGTALDGVAEGIYDVTLSGKSENTLFAQHYKDEMLLQYVDNLNVVYVALTRAKECMEIIAEKPAEADMDVAAWDDFSKILYWYANTYGAELGLVPEESQDDFEDDQEPEIRSFVYGEIPQARQVEDADGLMSMPARFCSWPLNPQEGVEDAPVNERGRLKFNADASDFFNEEGAAGLEASQRIKGIVLHDILAKVCVPGDLDQAVDTAVVSGTLPVDDAAQVKEMLGQRICSVESEGWFPQERSCVLNEIELIDTDGRIYRPDRVVRCGDKIRIVDYKFGEQHSRYERQLKRYADLWTRMGYDVESAKLWYVIAGEIVAVV